MALGTTNVSVSGIYSEVGKSTTTNLSLGDLRFAANDIDNQSFATTSSSSNVTMGNWRGYDHRSMKFRYNPPLGYETYYDTSSTALGSGLGFTKSNTTAGDYTGTLAYNGSNSYSYFDGVSGGTAYKQNSSGYTTIVFWIKMDNTPAANVNILTTDLDGLADNAPYKGFHFNLTTTGQIRPVRGDGTGTSSSDRRSFGTSYTLNAGEWQMCAFILSHNNNTASSSTNYSYTKFAGGEEEGLSFLSGTGGALAFEDGSGGSTDAMYLSTGVNSRYFRGSFGHFWVFAEALSADDITSLHEGTNSYYE